MKTIVVVISGMLLVAAALPIGCSPKAAPAAPTQNVTGVLTDVNTPAEPGADVVTIQTPQGPQTFPIAANATFTLEGQACILEDIGKVVEAANTTYQCIAYYDDRLNAVTSLKVWQSVGPLKNPN